MRSPDQWSNLFWLLTGIAITLGSLKYGFGNLQAPGAGFITFFAGAILSLLSIGLFFSSLKGEKWGKGLVGLWQGLEVDKVIYVFLLLIAYSLILKPLGFLITTFALLCLLFRVKARYLLLKIILISFLITAGCAPAQVHAARLWRRVPVRGADDDQPDHVHLHPARAALARALRDARA